MINEVGGLTSRKSETSVSIKILNNSIAIITDAIPATFEKFMGQTLTPELITSAMQNLADNLEQAVEIT
jgi:hypothetical protein